MKPGDSSEKMVFWGGFSIFMGIIFCLIFWSLYWAHSNAEEAAYEAEYQRTAKRFQLDGSQSRFEIALPPTYEMKEKTTDLVTFEQTQTRSANQIRIVKTSAPLDRREAQKVSLKNGGDIRYVYTRDHNPGSGGDTVLVNASLSLQNQHFSISCSIQSEWPSPDQCLYYIKQIHMIP